VLGSQSFCLCDLRYHSRAADRHGTAAHTPPSHPLWIVLCQPSEHISISMGIISNSIYQFPSSKLASHSYGTCPGPDAGSPPPSLAALFSSCSSSSSIPPPAAAAAAAAVVRTRFCRQGRGQRRRLRNGVDRKEGGEKRSGGRRLLLLFFGMKKGRKIAAAQGEVKT